MFAVSTSNKYIDPTSKSSNRSSTLSFYCNLPSS